MATLAATRHQTSSGRSFVLRTASRDDALAFMRYAHELFLEPDLFLSYSPGEFLPTLEEEERFIESAAGPHDLLLSAFSGLELIGLCQVTSGKVLRKRHVGLLGISVARDWRGQGVGTALLSRVLRWAVDDPQLERVELEVFSGNSSAQRLYERLGFEVEGRKRAALRIDDELHDCVLMGLLLPPKNL